MTEVACLAGLPEGLFAGGHAATQLPRGAAACRREGARLARGGPTQTHACRGLALRPGFLSTVLAHELGHVYMHLAGFPSDLAPVVAEGVCELFSFLWLEGGHPGGEAERRYRIEALKRRGSGGGDVYSEGYKQALACYYACGSSLTQVLQQVRRTRTLGTHVGRSPIRRPT